MAIDFYLYVKLDLKTAAYLEGLVYITVALWIWFIIPSIFASILTMRLIKPKKPKSLSILVISLSLFLTTATICSIDIWLDLEKGISPFNFNKTQNKDPQPKPTLSTLSYTSPQQENYLLKNDQSGTYLYIGDTKASLQSLPVRKTSRGNLWYQKPQNVLYTVENYTTEGKEYKRRSEISRYNLNQNPVKKEVLTTKINDVFGSTAIISYLPNEDTLLFDSTAGDGCGGVGEIWKISNSKISTIQRHGMGCVPPDLPRYLGIIGTNLVFANVNEAKEAEAEGSYNQIFTISPLNGKKTVIIN